MTPVLEAGAPPRGAGRRLHPVRSLVVNRVAIGLITVLAVSIVVFWATEVLPGNAAYAVLGRSATPARVRAVERQLHLDQGVVAQYWHWLSGVFSGNFGTSLVNGDSVWTMISPWLVNSAVLVVVAGFTGTVLGLALGGYAALRKDRLFDHAFSVLALAVAALPEFVIGVCLVIVFATNEWHVLPAVSTIPPGTYAWHEPKLLVLPVTTLVIIIIPYLFRMTRAAMIEALESEYVEMARLKGLSSQRIVLVHALPNAITPVIQVIGLNYLYLAGGIVVVEYVFNYPGIGSGLVSAVQNRDVPTVQVIVLLLAAFYIVVNILTDVVALAATPRRRIPR
jgi:peptide/nickel transport system permease protein